MLARIRTAARDHVRAMSPDARAQFRQQLLTGERCSLSLQGIGAVAFSARDLLVAVTDLLLEPVE